MVEEYLEKIRREIYEEKVCAERDYHRNELLLKENVQFVYTLESDLDKNYESFSPRNMNYESYEKIDSLKAEQKKIQDKSAKLEKKIVTLDSHLEELDRILRIAREAGKIEKSPQADTEPEQKEKCHKKILEIQELERQRIAGELQDSALRNLTGMVHKMEFCTQIIDMDTVRCKLELHSMTKLVRSTIEDMRQIINDLQSMSQENIGLSAMLKQEAARIQKGENILVDYKTTGKAFSLSPVISVTILRIVQEACNYAVKYGNASQITISVSYETNRIKLEIKDDGSGFDITKLQREKKDNLSEFGISIMKERVYLLSGKINIESMVGQGTKISVEIPINI